MNLLDRLDIINRDLHAGSCWASELREERRLIQNTLDTMHIKYYNHFKPLEEL